MVIRRRSGNVVEESTVFVDPNVKPRRNKRKGSTTAEKQEGNENGCARRLGRAINCNFSFGDLWTTPKYDDEGYKSLESWAQAHRQEGQSWEDAILDAAEREGQNYMRRVARLLKKKGMTDFRYILITTDMDGETGEPVRPHHHLIAPRVSFEETAKCWTLGTVDYQTLKQQDDYTPLAVYLMRQVRRRPDAKKYTCSRNLKKPLVNERWAKPGEVLKPDRGGKLMDRSEWQPGRPQYIRFVVKRGGTLQTSVSTGQLPLKGEPWTGDDGGVASPFKGRCPRCTPGAEGSPILSGVSRHDKARAGAGAGADLFNRAGTSKGKKNEAQNE